MDALTYNGVAAGDEFTIGGIAAEDEIQLANQTGFNEALNVSAPSVASLVVQGVGSNDQFSVDAPLLSLAA